MTESLKNIIELSKQDHFKTNITYDIISQAKNDIKLSPKTTDELFQIICSMNLINAAIKIKEFKKIVYYGMIKPQISKLLIYLIESDNLKLETQFYIDSENRCLYIEVYDLQFSFHDIKIDEQLKKFIDSSANKVQAWRGIKLQKVAVELFIYAKNKNNT